MFLIYVQFIPKTGSHFSDCTLALQTEICSMQGAIQHILNHRLKRKQTVLI